MFQMVENCNVNTVLKPPYTLLTSWYMTVYSDQTKCTPAPLWNITFFSRRIGNFVDAILKVLLWTNFGDPRPTTRRGSLCQTNTCVNAERGVVFKDKYYETSWAKEAKTEWADVEARLSSRMCWVKIKEKQKHKRKRYRDSYSLRCSSGLENCESRQWRL